MVRHLADAFRMSRNVRVHHVALSDRAGATELRVPIWNGKPQRGLATIDRGNELAGLPTVSVPVPLAMLDSFALQNIGFIKIDVEGHEAEVLSGATETLSRWQPDLLIEASERNRKGAAAAVIGMLFPRGYHGWFLWGDELVPVERFDLRHHQADDAQDELGRLRAERRYASNFVFSVRNTLSVR